MHRFYVPPAACRGDTITLEGGEAHHAVRVLRLRRGEVAAVLDGAGGTFSCEVAEVLQGKVLLQVKDRRMSPDRSFHLTLLQALPKGKLFESIVQKATELGVARIVPLLSERVVSQLEGDKAEARQGHWQHVAIEAIKQCGAAWLPRVELPVTPAAFMSQEEQFDLPLVASLQPGSRHPRHWFQEFRQQQGREPASICVWVGPEGDFTPAEIAAITAGGAHPITLGPLVLRVETAAAYCLSVLNYELTSPRLVESLKAER